MMSKFAFLLLLYTLLPTLLPAQGRALLMLPNREQLPSDEVHHVVQDDEGFLWYATSGGLCRDDGITVDVFRSDAAHPDLLGSNNVVCLAAAGKLIVIGTSHGGYVLDKRDYTIRRLDAVDDKRVDDILLLRSGEVLLTANRKIYRLSADGRLTDTYNAHGKYVARLFEDSSGRLWATQWDGGLLCMPAGNGGLAVFEPAPWPMDVFPTDIAETGDGRLWVGTAGKGVVRYHPENGTVEAQPAAYQGVCTDMLTGADGCALWVCTTEGLRLYDARGQLVDATASEMPSASASTIVPERMSLDKSGCLLAAGGHAAPVAIGHVAAWNVGKALTTVKADSIRVARHLEERPAAYCYTGSTSGGRQNASSRELWFSTGHDIRCQQPLTGDSKTAPATKVALDTKDVSAMAFTPDGTLWMGTIFGVLYAYKGGELRTDDYGSNEHGHAVVAITADSAGVLTIAYDRYARRYDTHRHTLRQQSIETTGTYNIELQPTQPLEHWSQPGHDGVVERLPRWLTSWWMMCLGGLLAAALVLLLIHYCILWRQRKLFVESMKTRNGITNSRPQECPSAEGENHLQQDSRQQEDSKQLSPFLKNAIEQVEAHLDDSSYGVEQLGSDLCMSRMSFYRRIQSETGQKPTEFIRTVRLRHAADMLRSGNQMSIKEISFATGFASVSYFSRCFHAMYGVSPTQYASEAG